MLLPGKTLYLDTETDGLYPNKNSIISLSVIYVEDGIPKGKKTFWICPKILLSCKKAYESEKHDPVKLAARLKEADKEYNIQQATHGILPSVAITFDAPSVVFPQILKFLEKFVDPFKKNKDKFADKLHAAGHNTDFDMRMLKGLFESQGHKFFYSFFGPPMYDTMLLAQQLRAMGHVFAENCKLEVLCKAFGIPIEAHNSASDIMATYMLHLRLLRYVMEQ